MVFWVFLAKYYLVAGLLWVVAKALLWCLTVPSQKNPIVLALSGMNFSWCISDGDFSITLCVGYIITPVGGNKCLYEWLTKSFRYLICSKHWFILKRNMWLSIWVSHWITHSTNLFKTLVHLGTKQITVYMSESVNYLLNQFIENTDSFRNIKKWLYHQIIQLTDLWPSLWNPG